MGEVVTSEINSPRIKYQIIKIIKHLFIFFSFIFFQNEKTQLHTHRSTMLRLNASVHSWLTRQEMKMAKLSERQKALEHQQSIESNLIVTKVTEITDGNNMADQTESSANTTATTTSTATTSTVVNNVLVDNQETAVQFDINFVDEELHTQLKNEVGDMYSAWDEADHR